MQIVSPNLTYAWDFHDWPVSRSHCTRYKDSFVLHTRAESEPEYTPEAEFAVQEEGRLE